MDNIPLDSKEHRDRLTKGTLVRALKFPDRVGIIHATPTHPNTWFTVKFEESGDTHTFRPKELTLIGKSAPPQVGDKSAVAKLKSEDALLADPLSESEDVKDNDDEASIASSRDGGRGVAARVRSASIDENGNDTGSVNSATINNQSAKAIASKNLIDKKVQLSDGRIGTVLKSGHGFYTIDIEGTNERVMKRKEDLTVYTPTFPTTTTAAATTAVNLIKGGTISPNKSAKGSPARPAATVPAPAPTGGVSKPRGKGEAETHGEVAVAAPVKEEKQVVEELSAVDEERASKQSRAAMIRAQAEHAERIKEFVARHQRRCFSENRPNLTLWFDEFASDDENNEEKRCALAEDFLPNHRCKECKVELGLDWSYCWNMTCKACPAYDENAHPRTSFYEKEKKLAQFASESARRLSGKNNIVDKTPTEKLIAFDSEATVYYLGRYPDKDGGHSSESYLDYSWRRDLEGTVASNGGSLKRKREGEGDNGRKEKRVHTDVAV